MAFGRGMAIAPNWRGTDGAEALRPFREFAMKPHFISRRAFMQTTAAGAVGLAAGLGATGRALDRKSVV